MKRTILWCVPLLLVVVMASAALAYAATVHATHHSEWGPTHGTSDGSPEHVAWPIPHDCGDGKHQRHDTRRGDLKGTAEADRLWGHDGCDFFWANAGNDVVFLGKEMDAGYGGVGDDRIFGNRGHDHLFGDGAKSHPHGNDYLHTRDGIDEVGNVEEIHGGGGVDRCFFDPDPDGHKFSECEYLNGKKNPWGHGPDRYINTSDKGNHPELRAEVNKFLGG
jgi:hypothetical protein